LIVDVILISLEKNLLRFFFQTCQHSYATKIGFYSSYKTCICEFDSHEQIQVFSFKRAMSALVIINFNCLFTIFWEVLSLELFFSPNSCFNIPLILSATAFSYGLEFWVVLRIMFFDLENSAKSGQQYCIPIKWWIRFSFCNVCF
jgi:hypothetical protein